jgi:thioredoxin reductase
MVDALMGNLFIWFRKKGVIMMPGVKDMEITERGLSFTNPKGEKEVIIADSIIPAVELAPDTGLLESLKGKVSEIYTIGDCQEPNLIVDAIAAGSRVARSI